MTQRRKLHSVKFKFDLALEAAKVVETVNQIASTSKAVAASVGRLQPVLFAKRQLAMAAPTPPLFRR